MKTDHRRTGTPKALANRGIATLTAAQMRKRSFHLRELLKIADTAFTNASEPKFPSELLEIPKLVAELQRAIGKTSAYRAPFWKCVVALDHAQPGLALIATLDGLVKRACSLPPGPLVQLRTLQQQGVLRSSDSTLVDELASMSDKQLDEPPPAAAKWTSILERVASQQYRKKANSFRINAAHLMHDHKVKDFMAFCLYRDFAYEHRKWLDRYLPSLEPFALFLAELENEAYDQQRNCILFGYVRDNKTLKRAHAKAMSAARQREYRKTPKGRGRKASKPAKRTRIGKKRTLEPSRKR
jgi:hypothetical protein